jgi:phospholipid/cholesterol/gamma-HCH transport system permease protein
LNAVRAIGRSTLDLVRSAGAVAIFAGRGVGAAFSPPFFPRQLRRQAWMIGYTSLPAVALTAVFTGAALALNIYTGGGRFNAEQIDALQTLSVDPYRYTIAPRLTAAVLTLPLLTVVADIIGIAGGWLVSTATLNFNGQVYVRNTWSFLTSGDITSGLIKAAVFGFIVALMGCYHGFFASGGARGVGRATTNAVVSAYILVFASDYVMTSLLR